MGGSLSFFSAFSRLGLAFGSAWSVVSSSPSSFFDRTEIVDDYCYASSSPPPPNDNHSCWCCESCRNTGESNSFRRYVIMPASKVLRFWGIPFPFFKNEWRSFRILVWRHFLTSVRRTNSYSTWFEWNLSILLALHAQLFVIDTTLEQSTCVITEY